ncbi:MAG: ABC transporter permease subunit [Sedimentitalea sp.]|uniref:ABC transporter permease n=1 Tax=Sedimentitalea sp. TaxID=2048915 RepID=UPI003263131A
MTRAFPLPLLALPLAVMFIQTGLDYALFGLALMHTTLAIPFAVLITFSLFSGIPVELEEVAWTLGCTRVTAFTKVVLPLILPGITEPPVAGFAIRRIHDRALEKTLAAAQAKALLPRIHAWHQWFYRARDPQGTGLVSLLHPWEPGRDNSADWDDAFSRVPTEGVGAFTRRDTTHANPAHRPTDSSTSAISG